MFEPDIRTNYREANKRALRKEIRKARDASDGIIGVNIMIALTDSDDLTQAAVDEGADIVFIGAGLPLKTPKVLNLDSLEQVSTKFVPIVSSPRAAQIIFQYWAKAYNFVPDAVVVEGPLAGGHLGFKKEQIENPDYALEKILTDVFPVIKRYEEQFGKSIPVIAAGGIYTGADIYKFLQSGVQGVQMATRFVATHECDATMEFKEMYVNCKKEDLLIIESPVGLPGRAIINQYIKDVSSGIRKPFNCPWRCLRTCDFKTAPYCIALALSNAKLGYLEEGFTFAGTNAYRIDEIISVKKLINTIVDEYKQSASEEVSVS